MEMLEALSLDLVYKRLVTNQLVITIGYDIENITNLKLHKYCAEITKDFYGRLVPKSAHGSINLNIKTSSTKIIVEKGLELFTKIVNDKLLIRRINICANNVVLKNKVKDEIHYEQFNLFEDYSRWDDNKLLEKNNLKEEEKIQEVMINIKNKYGKNSILKLVDLSEGATMISRNNQVGGHSA